MKTDYDTALGAVRKLEESGIDLECVCVAKELCSALVVAKKRLAKSKKAIDLLDADTKILYHIILSSLEESHGASTPKDVVETAFEGYLDGGMSIDRAKAALSDVPFVGVAGGVVGSMVR